MLGVNLFVSCLLLHLSNVLYFRVTLTDLMIMYVIDSFNLCYFSELRVAQNEQEAEGLGREELDRDEWVPGKVD